MSERTGQCLCGAVSFTARNVPDTVGICHCEMCRRWTGSALIEVSVAEEDVTWKGTNHIATWQGSSWAERAWCRTCGSGLYFRFTGEGEFGGKYDIPLGIFNNPNGFTISHEIFVDHKPDSFAYAGEGRQLLTRAECVEKFPLLETE